MKPEDELVRAIISQASIPSARERLELERELKAHLEDAEEGAGTGESDARICDHFGDPAEIALQFKKLHRFDRIASSVLETLLLALVSAVAIAALIGVLQFSIALCLGVEPGVPRRLPQQLASIFALVLGYVGMYSGDRVFENGRILKSLAMSAASCAPLIAICLFLPHFDATAPVLTFAIGIGVWMLQCSRLRRFWVLAPIAPLIGMCLFAQRAVSIGNGLPVWVAATIRCVGLTAACHALTWLSRVHQARRPA